MNAEGKTVSVGSYMIPLLQENCEKAGVKMMLDTTATEILTDANGAAVGVKATGASGETVTVNAKAVVLASGGFGANLDMVVKYKPELKGFMTTNAPGIQGQGIEMAQAIGAATVDMDQIQIHPTVEANTAALITEGLRGDGAILINEEGQRFIDEVGTRDVVSAAEIAQTGHGRCFQRHPGLHQEGLHRHRRYLRGAGQGYGRRCRCLRRDHGEVERLR